MAELQCEQCHGTTLSGNDDGIQIPGTTAMQYPPNLTPDPATGLGCWTNDQVETAILDSVDNQGDAICGPMPHFSALGLTQSDAAAITAYLRSLPAFQNNPQGGPSCACQTDGDCPMGESCLDAGSCTCTNLACAIPALADGGPVAADAGLDGGHEDGGRHEDAGRTPDAGRDAGAIDGGIFDAGVDGGADGGAADGGHADAGEADGGTNDAGPIDAGQTGNGDSGS